MISAVRSNNWVHWVLSRKKVYASFEIRDVLFGAKGFVITETIVSSILFPDELCLFASKDFENPSKYIYAASHVFIIIIESVVLQRRKWFSICDV